MDEFINTVDIIGDDALTDSIIDKSITEYKDDVITKVGDGAFNACKALTSVDLPNVKSIGSQTFYNCSALTSVDLHNVTSIGDYNSAVQAFSYCSALTSIDFPNVTVVGGSAFGYCKALTSVNLPNVTHIGTSAFQGCSALTSVNLPNATHIGRSSTYNGSAFSSCKSLTRIELPSILYMYHATFAGCSNLTTLILSGQNLCSLSSNNAFNNTPIASGTGYIYVPRALIDSYKTASDWSTYANQFRALEDYTVDGTINGELDENKVNPWGAVANAIANGTYKDVYKIGDTVPLHLGTYGEVDMEIVAFDADDKADGSGKAPITWISKDLITRHKLNSTDTNAGGWLGCELRSWMRSDLYNSIPEAIRNSIVEVNKTYADFVSTNTTETKTCVDNIWIPSDLEVTGVVSNFETSGCNYATHFNNVGLAKYIEKIYSEAWWLRSSAEKNNAWMRSVTKQGGVDYAHPTGDFGVVLGFCT